MSLLAVLQDSTTFHNQGKVLFFPEAAGSFVEFLVRAAVETHFVPELWEVKQITLKLLSGEMDLVLLHHTELSGCASSARSSLHCPSSSCKQGKPL